jgi:DNA-binding NtrC family response regulator
VQENYNPIDFPPGEKPTILLVEDHPHELELMRDWLSLEGVPSITAGSVATAITALDNHRATLLVLDWRLDRCGAEVLRHARMLDPDMPVIVVSGQDHDVRTDAILGQADVFLRKPFSGTVLNEQIKQLLKRCDVKSKAFLPHRPEEILPLSEIKELYVRQVLRLLDNNISLAAKKLGIHRQTVARFAPSEESSQPSEESFTA